MSCNHISSTLPSFVGPSYSGSRLITGITHARQRCSDIYGVQQCGADRICVQLCQLQDTFRRDRAAGPAIFVVFVIGRQCGGGCVTLQWRPHATAQGPDYTQRRAPDNRRAPDSSRLQAPDGSRLEAPDGPDRKTGNSRLKNKYMTALISGCPWMPL